MSGLVERLSFEAGRLARHITQAALTSREVQTATHLLFPGELAKRCGQVRAHHGQCREWRLAGASCGPADSVYVEAALNARQDLEESERLSHGKYNVPHMTYKAKVEVYSHYQMISGHIFASRAFKEKTFRAPRRPCQT